MEVEGLNDRGVGIVFARQFETEIAGFRPGLVDRLPLPVLRPAHIPDGFPRVATRSGGGGSPVALLARH